MFYRVPLARPGRSRNVSALWTEQRPRNGAGCWSASAVRVLVTGLKCSWAKSMHDSGQQAPTDIGEAARTSWLLRPVNAPCCVSVELEHVNMFGV